jgi:sugar lactone lactonase YvrE
MMDMAGTSTVRHTPDLAIRTTETLPCLAAGAVLDQEGNLFVADIPRRQVRKLAPNGSVLVVLGPSELSLPAGLAVDSAGSLFIADSQRHRVLRVAPDGSVTRVAGTGVAGFAGDGGPASVAQLNRPWGLAIDHRDQLYIADAGNHRIRRVAPEGTITTVAGTGEAGFSGDRGQATMARLDRPLGLAVDSRGNLFVVDSLNGRVRMVDPEGVITTVFGSGGGKCESPRRSPRYYPATVAVDQEGNLWVADPFQLRVIKIAGVAAPRLATQ